MEAGGDEFEFSTAVEIRSAGQAARADACGDAEYAFEFERTSVTPCGVAVDESEDWYGEVANNCTAGACTQVRVNMTRLAPAIALVRLSGSKIRDADVNAPPPANIEVRDQERGRSAGGRRRKNSAVVAVRPTTACRNNRLREHPQPPRVGALSVDRIALNWVLG
jgi:hypothetical protein